MSGAKAETKRPRGRPRTHDELVRVNISASAAELAAWDAKCERLGKKRSEVVRELMAKWSKKSK